jgi:ligand-binding SRPBCC domain-containing protein
MPIFEKRTRIAAPPERVFAFHEQPDALEQLMPPWERSRVVEKTPGLEVGTRVVLETWVGPIKQRIVAEHTRYEAGRMFQDRMQRGPLKKWEHTHTMDPDGEGGTWLIDHIEYELPLGLLGHVAGGWFVRRMLTRMFDYRHRVTKAACEASSALPTAPSMH